jgi:plastocyanin
MDATGPQGDIIVGTDGSTMFTPSSLNLMEPRAVTWYWQMESGLHDIVFEDGMPGSGQRSSGIFVRDFTMAAPGTYAFRCTLHSSNFSVGMVGSVIVP